MAIYHCSIKIISRGKGKSAVAAAYRAGEKITNDFDGETHDYPRKGGVVHTEILLPRPCPRRFLRPGSFVERRGENRESEKRPACKGNRTALPRELTREQGSSLVREYVKAQFVNAGMCADFAIHDTGGGNPHAHVMLTMRPIEQDGTWGAKQKKEYILDQQGEKIYDRKKRQYKCKSIPATDWNEQTKAEEWRAAWAEICNRALEQNGHAERIDHRSYERRGIDQIPTVHLGVAASAMEKRGIRTERGDLNREIEVTNQKLRQLKARIAKLQKWLKEEQENTEPPTLADYIQGILSRRAQEGKSQVSQSLYNLKDAAKMLSFLQANNIMDTAGLDEKFKSMIGEQLDIQGKLKPVERRLATLKKAHRAIGHLFQVQGKKEADRSRANKKERLQYLAAGTAGTNAAQDTRYGAVTDRAAG